MRSGGSRAGDAPRGKNYEMQTMTFQDEATVVNPATGEAVTEPFTTSGKSNNRDNAPDAMDQRRNRLSFYLNRRSVGAVQYWQKRQEKEQQAAAEREAAAANIEPTAESYRSAAQQALVAAMDVNSETLDAIKHMEHVMIETERIGQESAGVIQKGTENLEVLDATLVDMDPILQRAKKDLVVFARRMMRDKICVCLTFIALGMAVAVVLVAKLRGKAPSLPTIEFLPNSTTQF